MTRGFPRSTGGVQMTLLLSAMSAGWCSEERWLRRHLRHAEFRSILDPQALGEGIRRYGPVHLFVADRYFGNVVQESFASGIAALVTNGGGPQTIVEDGVTGLVASNQEELCQCVTRTGKGKNSASRFRNPPNRRCRCELHTERTRSLVWCSRRSRGGESITRSLRELSCPGDR
jgi:hypothetical protein